MNKRIFVMVPALDDTGPVKGAVALCNALLDFFGNQFEIILISLKGAKKCRVDINQNIKRMDLGNIKGFFKKRLFLKTLLQKENAPVLVSFCFSADFLNYALQANQIRISSVRGNLLKNYYFSYGVLGTLLARFHYFILRKFYKVLALSETLKSQLDDDYGLKNTTLIGNFVDEPALTKERLKSTPDSSRFNFVFLGNLIKRKRPELILESFFKLRSEGLDCQITFIGDGPLRDPLKLLAAKSSFHADIHFLGHLENPYIEIQKGNVFVLPSESEGIPRAALEALFFGIPCILRDVDANFELIQSGVNGWLFANDLDLFNIMKQSLDLGINRSNTSLVPEKFSMQYNANKFRELIENI